MQPLNIRIRPPIAQPPRRAQRLAPWLFFLLFTLLGGAIWFGRIPWPTSSVPSASAVVRSSLVHDTAPQYVTKEIRDIRIFDWVLARNPELTDAERVAFPEIEPDRWRLVKLRMPKQDGSRLDICLARPLKWVAANRATPGGTLYLNLPEMGAEGPAEVRSVRRCPRPEPKPDPRCRLVTGTFRHTTADILDISVAGQSKPIGTTSAHPFWSEDRQAFIPAGQLRQGERLRTAHGEIKHVASIVPRAASEPVYNLEVDVEHVYCVTADGVLVHNEYPRKNPLDPYKYDRHPESQPLGKGVQPGTYVYVGDIDGNIHIAPNGPHMHPKVLGGATPATSAGEITIDTNGVVSEINNASGTFQFGEETLDQVEDAVVDLGFDVASDAKKPFQW